MSQTWRQSARLLLAAGLAVTLAQSLSPTAASTMPAAASSEGPRTGTAPARAQLLKPNLVALKANDLQIQQTARGRFLRFESGIGNVGRGPIEIRPNTSRPCPTGKHHATQIIYRDVDGSRFYRRDVDKRVARRSAGCMVFHPAHDHWHFQAASRYTLFQPDGDRERRLVTVARRKMSFCLRDSERLPERYGAFHYPEFYGACSKNSPQGISVGWVDIYQSFLAGQALRLPDRARDGLYCLHIAVDPRDELVETDDADNDSTRAFELLGDRVTLRNARICR